MVLNNMLLILQFQFSLVSEWTPMFSTRVFCKKRPMNRKFGHCFLRFIGKLSLIITWLEREDSQL